MTPNEQKFYDKLTDKYLKILPKTNDRDSIASDLALIANEGKKVIYNGKLDLDEIDFKLCSYENKKVIITLEVVE